jgi:hypothetical protein
MANSGGGVIVYGVCESQKVAIGRRGALRRALGTFRMSVRNGETHSWRNGTDVKDGDGGGRRAEKK